MKRATSRKGNGQERKKRKNAGEKASAKCERVINQSDNRIQSIIVVKYLTFLRNKQNRTR